MPKKEMTLFERSVSFAEWVLAKPCRTCDGQVDDGAMTKVCLRPCTEYHAWLGRKPKEPPRQKTFDF